MKYRILVILFTCTTLLAPAQNNQAPVRALALEFIAEYQAAKIPWMRYDYREYFKEIPIADTLEKRLNWLGRYQHKLHGLTQENLNPQEAEMAKLLEYYLQLHQRRWTLELDFKKSNSAIPENGLFNLKNGKDWYRFFIEAANGMAISPEEIYQFGLSEVDRVQSEIKKIRASSAFASDSTAFMRHLQEPTFFLTDRDTIIRQYQTIEAIARKNLSHLFTQDLLEPPAISCMTWPDAGPYTPPAIYLPKEENSYEMAVFQFNFFGGKHNRRAMDWIFIHEAIPGHHFQRYATAKNGMNPFAQLFFEGATIEGWATYVEYLGASCGLYTTTDAWLGKWEWDLVRSARVTISAGIHYYGWTKAEALAYWKKNVPGQDEIADREITRCTHWPAQVLTYKVGAKAIFDLRNQWENHLGTTFDVKKYHSWFLSKGNMPFSVIKALSDVAEN